MKRLFTAHLSAVALLLAVGAGAQAGPMPPGISWTYNWTPGAPSVTADGSPPPAAGVTFTNEPTKNAVGNSDIVATNLRVFSSATAANPNVLSTNGAYSLALTLSVNDNGHPFSTTLSFTGKLSGTFSSESANVSNMFTGSTTKTVQLGSYNFTVVLNSYTPPGPPDQSNAGSIAAFVSITKIQPTQETPEPSTLLLSSLGMTFLGSVVWRKRRQPRTAKA
jgi:hypothetical protein